MLFKIPLVQGILHLGVLFPPGHLVALEAPVNIQYVTQTVSDQCTYELSKRPKMDITVYATICHSPQSVSF